MNKHSGKPHQQNSISEVHESVLIPTKGPWWRHWLAISGPALMVAVGYMDPGNWATDIAGGSRYNYTLIWVLLMSNMMAILLQTLAARLGIVRRRDLAQICHEEYPPVVNIPLYILTEIAITACDLAEVIGSAIALTINALNVEMVIVGSHGHTGVSDLIHGTVISDLRHHIHAKLLIVPLV